MPLEVCATGCPNPSYRFEDGFLMCVLCGTCVNGSQQLVADWSYINHSSPYGGGAGGSTMNDSNFGFNYFNHTNTSLDCCFGSAAPVSRPLPTHPAVVAPKKPSPPSTTSNTMIGNAYRLNTINAMAWNSANKNVLKCYEGDFKWLQSVFQPTDHTFELTKQIMQAYIKESEQVSKGVNKKKILVGCLFFALKAVPGGGMTKDAISKKSLFSNADISKACNQLENSLQRVEGPFSVCFQRNLTFDDICPKIIQNLSNLNDMDRKDGLMIKKYMHKVYTQLNADADFRVMSLRKSLAGIMSFVYEKLHEKKVISSKTSDVNLANASNMCTSTLMESKIKIQSMYHKRNFVL